MAIRRKEQSSESAIRNLIKHLGLEERLFTLQVEEIWCKMMGNSISNHTKKIYIENNTLFIFIDSAAIRHELHLSKNKILQNIHKELEEEYFKNIRFM